jgi:serine/threonine protein kinase/predicted Zn-dependent protease
MPLPTPEDLLARLGDQYSVERELVGGGMARVFLAEDRELGRKVVIKVLPPEVATGVSASRFRSEILTVAKLQHPHIVGILKAGEVEGIPYFVMPFVHGESLAVHLRREGPSSARDAIAVFRDVARALAFAHANGIVHRDIKPGNILLSSGSATVTDFGVAKALSSALRSGPGSRHTTDTGVSLGTLLYMAPEQAAGDPDIDGRADIYSLGITIYEMLAGTAPFAGLSPREMLTARLTQKPPALLSIRNDVPQRLATLISRCLEADPAARPQTAAEVVDWLEAPDMPSGSSEVDSGAWVIARPRHRKWIAAASAAVLLGIPAVYAIGSRASAPETQARVPALDAAAQSEIVAVMPFVSNSPDSANTYIAAGLTNALASRLSRAAGLNVMAPTRAVHLASNPGMTRGRSVMVLEGVVERDGNLIRIIVSLSDSESGIMEWSDVFDTDPSKMLEVEQEIADQIVAAVAPKAAPKVDSFKRATASLSPEQYDRYLKAKYDLAQRGAGSIRDAISALSDITGSQPGFAPAFAALSQAYLVLPLYSSIASGDSLRRLALAAATSAVSLDPQLAEAYTARAMARSASWQWKEAEADFRKSLALDSLNARTHQWYGEHLLVTGNAVRAVSEISTAARIDPSSPIIAGSLGVALVHAGRKEEAMKQAQAAAAMDPSFATTHFMYGAVLLYSGRPADALVLLGQALSLAPDSRIVWGLVGYANAAAGNAQQAHNMLRRLEQSPPAPGTWPAIARIRTALGDADGGLEALEKAAAVRDPFFATEPLTSPPFHSLASSPRLAALKKKLGRS